MIQGLFLRAAKSINRWLNGDPWVHPSLRSPPKVYKPLSESALKLSKRPYLGPRKHHLRL